jgi:hypothetical protein
MSKEWLELLQSLLHDLGPEVGLISKEGILNWSGPSTEKANAALAMALGMVVGALAEQHAVGPTKWNEMVKP